MIYSLNQIDKIAGEIIDDLQDYKVICINGDMGVGKTTLIKKIGQLLGVSDEIHSPTFGIVNEYNSGDNKPIYHFDFYRINNVLEAVNLGIEDYFYSNHLCFIEWSEKISVLLPEKYLKINIKLISQRQREISFESYGTRK
tara:strand:+ start:941 stop:1363 length:423 start_codon:yes stop_codon:yes gene_type:complete